MTLLRVFSAMDDKGKVAIPRGIRKELDIKPGRKLELRVVGVDGARKLLVSKSRENGIRCKKRSTAILEA